MNIKFEPKSTGYVNLHRSIQKLLKKGTLSLTTLGAYILFALQADWDKNHSRYRAILLNDKELSLFSGLSETTISRNKKALIILGLLEKNGAITYVKNLDMFRVGIINKFMKKNLLNPEEYYLKSESDLAKTMFDIAETEESEADLF